MKKTTTLNSNVCKHNLFVKQLLILIFIIEREKGKEKIIKNENGIKN